MTRNIDKLIIVPGHAPFKNSVEKVPDNFQEDKYWVLQEFQRGEPPYYIEHIKEATKLAELDKKSLLVFSGGRSRPESENWSEAATYKAIYDRLNPDSPSDNVELEKFARDSFENLKFSLYQFYRKIGRYPVHVTVAGWIFKRERFCFHADTLGIDPAHFTYAGVNNPKDLAGALKGEERALTDFRNDPFGDKGVLASKRLERNPFNDTNPYDGLPPIVIGNS